MKKSTRLALRLGAVALLATLVVSRGESQDPNLKPTFGTLNLKAGFSNDPRTVKIVAGGDLHQNNGNVKAWVAKAPDFRVNYTAGAFNLTFHVKSKADTTLLINLPNGKWIANDDGPNNGLNPLIKLTNPPSGQYDIWVGVLNENENGAASVLYITELK
jgi:hypothetical protein